MQRLGRAEQADAVLLPPGCHDEPAGQLQRQRQPIQPPAYLATATMFAA